MRPQAPLLASRVFISTAARIEASIAGDFVQIVQYLHGSVREVGSPDAALPSTSSKVFSRPSDTQRWPSGRSTGARWHADNALVGSDNLPLAIFRTGHACRGCGLLPNPRRDLGLRVHDSWSRLLNHAAASVKSAMPSGRFTDD